MARVMKCDRCGKCYDPYNKVNDKMNGVKTFNSNIINSIDDYDLCIECANSFNRWLNEGKIEENKNEITESKQPDPIDPEGYNYTREMLVDICEKAFVNEDDWKNRDTEEAQKQLGVAYALLRAGCDFEITEETCEHTIWVRIFSKGFTYFEYGDGQKNEEDYYLPTYRRLKDTNNKDWY